MNLGLLDKPNDSNRRTGSNIKRHDQGEKELIAIFRRLGRREKHEMMAKAYELEKGK